MATWTQLDHFSLALVMEYDMKTPNSGSFGGSGGEDEDAHTLFPQGGRLVGITYDLIYIYLLH